MQEGIRTVPRLDTAASFVLFLLLLLLLLLLFHSIAKMNRVFKQVGDAVVFIL